MRGIISFLQIILCILGGYFFMALISCNTANMKLALILIVIDIILGALLSSIYLKNDDSRERMERQLEAIERYSEYLEEQKKNEDDKIASEDKAEEKEAESESKREPSPYEKRLISLFKLGMSSNQFRGNDIKGDEETLDKLLKRFYVVHTKVKISGDRNVDDIMDDEACAYLVDVCNWLEYPPAIKSLLNIYMVGPSDIGDIPAICYSFDYPPRSIACTMLLILARTPNRRFRLFALETGARGSIVLCEYSGHSHLNYGEANTPGDAINKIKELVNNERGG